MWKKIEKAEDVKKIPVGGKVRVNGRESVVCSHYEDDDFGFDVKAGCAVCNVDVRSGMVTIEYWEEDMYKIDESKVEFVQQFPKMKFVRGQRYIIPVNNEDQAKLVNEACQERFGDLIDADAFEETVGDGFLINENNKVFYSPHPSYEAMFVDPDTFIIMSHPKYNREVVEVLGNKYHKHELESRLRELTPVS